MRKLPFVSTLLVALAVATMVALGFWQMGRVEEKEQLLALYRANITRPAMPFPATAPVPDEARFRRSAVDCLEPGAWRLEGGRARSGITGYRHIVDCRAGDGASALVDLGVSRDPTFEPSWPGGKVAGVIATEPLHDSFLSRLFTRAPPARAMLVSETPAPGLAPSLPPSPEDVPNNHLAYAGQWFLFAAAALVIYALALRRRWREASAR